MSDSETVYHDQTPGDTPVPPASTPEDWRVEPGKTGTSWAEPDSDDQPAPASGSPAGSGTGSLSMPGGTEGDVGMVGKRGDVEDHNSEGVHLGRLPQGS